MNRVLIIGVGDLGSKIALGLVRESAIDELVITSHTPQIGLSKLRVLSACGNVRVRQVTLDALNVDAIGDLLQQEAPSVVVQAASLMSPWYSSEVTNHTTALLRDSPFALQIGAHLPIIFAVMRAVTAVGYANPVVNASYPDVTHPILDSLGLAPTIGVGNVGMIQRTLQLPILSDRHDRNSVIRTVSHHSQVSAVMRSDSKLLRGAPVPRIFVDSAEIDSATFLFSPAPIIGTRELNSISAAHARDVIMSLLPGGPDRTDCAPGIKGRPGGWPVRFRDGGVEIDLPDGLSEEEVMRFNVTSAESDGVAHIDRKGTLFYTQESRDAVQQLCPDLAEPLPIHNVAERWELLRRLCSNGSQS